MKKKSSVMSSKEASDHPLVKGRHTINPYTSNGILILRRLCWDLHLQSWISRRKLKKWKNSYQDRKAIILCNGPSLNKVPLDAIPSDCFTFGLNKINLLFDRSSFRPNCIVAVNPLVIEQNKLFYNATDIPLFLDSDACKQNWVSSHKHIIFLDSNTRHLGFARDCSISVNQGSTVTFVALQLAFHMGFSTVALVGADHTFAEQGPANMTVVGGAVDQSHFDPRYFAHAQWQLPDLLESERAYTLANNVYHAHKRKIYNCTEGGKLKIFDCLPFSTFMSLTSNE